MADSVRTVLVIDDAPDSRLMIQRLLERANYRVLVADRGEAGLALAEAESPDLIALDFVMPEMDGAEVLRRLRAHDRTRGIPVVMLTASHDDEHIDAAFAAGANDYINKPIDRRILTARISATIRAAEDQAQAKKMVEVDRERNELLNEFRDAARIQMARLPTLPVTINDWTVAGGLLASRNVGGDFFDLTTGADGEVILSLVDVSGHGLGAAMVAGLVGSQLRSLARTHSLVETIHLVNRFLAQEGGDKYACLATMALGRGTVTIINAGLPPISLIRNGISVRVIDCTGTPPGLLQDPEYQSETFTVEPGDRMVVMSDGLTEPFGAADRVSTSLDALGLSGGTLPLEGLTPEALASSITVLLSGVPDDMRDDATIVIAEYAPSTGPKSRRTPT